MGQEWAASSPFLYFTDHQPALGEAITEGRRAEFAAFSAFSDPASRSSIPDPQNPETFYASRLKWDERDQADHAGTLRLYAQLLALRRSLVDLSGGGAAVGIRATGDQTILMRRTRTNGEVTLVLVCLGGEGSVAIDCDARNCRVALTTEDPEFAPDGRPPSVDTGEGLRVTFHGAAAIVLNETRVQAVRPSNDFAASSSGS
jgi:maltooligosyltrehalose trehalohydrolase